MQRMKDGEGRFVDISMLDACFSLHSHILTRHEGFDKFGEPGGKGMTPPRTGPWWYVLSLL